VSEQGVARGAERTVTYTVKIALANDELSRGEYRGRVKLGMTGQAHIVTGHRSLLALLVKADPPDDPPGLWP
jgi:hypothetical protein